ncbi:MAG: hypothetical protein KDD47_22495 [Acidobacteria bacterium]|nr:hypothetical protein [Acidobacteriota bacterium]
MLRVEPRKNVAAWRMTALISAILATLVLAVPQEAAAGTIDCPVKVTDFWIYARTGHLFASVRWDTGSQTEIRTWALCNLKTGANGIEPAVCSEIHSELLVARTLDKLVIFSFLDTVPSQDGAGTAATCQEIWNFNAAVSDHLWYVRVKNN